MRCTRVCCCFLPECVLFLTKIIQTHSVPATSFTLHSMLSVIIWQVTHSFCTTFSAHSHITQNGIHSHARGPHSVAFTRLHLLSFVYIHDGPHSVTLHTQFIHYHSLRSTFTFDTTRIQSEQHSTPISFMVIHVHTQTVTFTSNLIHGTFTGPLALVRHDHIHSVPHSTAVFIRFHSSQTAFISIQISFRIMHAQLSFRSIIIQTSFEHIEVHLDECTSEGCNVHEGWAECT